MMKFVELTAIDARAEAEAVEAGATLEYLPPMAPAPEPASARFENLDYDDLERPVPAAPISIPTFRTNIVLAHVREWYPRKKNAQGTRIVFANGAATIVKETFDEVTAKFCSLNN